MDIALINELIDELKQCDTTYNNVRDLAALYEVRDKFEEKEEPIQTETEKELHDILPAYESYIDEKRKYQLGEKNIELLQSKIKLLCIEVFEFLAIIYRNTETQEERQELKKCVTRLSSEL